MISANNGLYLTIADLRALLEDAATVAVATFIRQQSPSKDRISQRKAFELYGEARVRSWVNKGKILPLRDGDNKNSTLYYSVTELKTLEAAEKAIFSIKLK